MAVKDTEQAQNILEETVGFVKRANDPTDLLTRFAEGKAYTPFDRSIRDALGLFLDNDEDDKEDKKESEIDEQTKTLLFDSESNTYFYPEERERARKLASTLGNYSPQGGITTTSPDVDVIRLANQLNEAQASRPTLPEEEKPTGPLTASDILKQTRLPEETTIAEDIGNYFGADLIREGGMSLWSKTLAREVNQDLKVAELGLARGFAALPQMMQVLYKYGFGTLEQGVRGITGQGFVDYDRLIMSNTLWKNISDESEMIVKDFEKFLGLRDLDAAENILLFTADLAVPLGYPQKVYKALKMAATVGNATMDLLPLYTRPVPTAVAEVEIKNMEPVLKAEAEFKDAQIKSGQTWEQATRNWNKTPQGKAQKKIEKDPNVSSAWQQSLDIAQKRAEAKDRILKEALRNLKDSEGRTIVFEKWGNKAWWQWKTKPIFKDKTSGESAMARRRVGTTEGGAPVYDDVLLIRRKTPEQIRDEEQYKKLLHGQSIVSAGAISGTWQSYFEGTELEEFSYAVGMAGILTTPTATMRMIDLLASTTATGLQRYAKIPFGNMLKMPGTDANFELSLPSVLYLGGLLLSRAGTALRGEAPIDVLTETSFGKRVTAMSRGIPFYKALFLDDKTKLKMAGEETGATALDAAISLHGVNIKAREKMADWVDANMPQEFIDSIQGLFSYGMKLEKRLNEIGRGDKLEAFFLTMDELLGAVRLQMESAVLSQMTKDKAFVQSTFGFKNTEAEAANIITTFRVNNQETMERLQFLEDAMKDLIGGDARLAKEFETLNKVVQTFVKTSRGRAYEARDFFSELSNKNNIFVNLEKTIEMNKVLRASREEGGLDLGEKLGIGKTVGERREARKKFGDSLQSQTNYFYDIQRQAKDREYEALIGEDYDRVIGVTPFIDSLEQLRKMNIDEFGTPLFNMLKNKNRLMVFGSSKPIESGQEAIDSAIAYARFNGLEGKSLSELKDLLLDITTRTSRQELDLDIFDYSFIDSTGRKVTLDIPQNAGADLKQNLGSLFDDAGDGETFLELFSRNKGISQEDYLRRIISNLYSNDEATRDLLNRQIDTALTVGELHTVRSNLSGWSYQKRNTPAGRKAHELVKGMDESFDVEDIESVKKANEAYATWRNNWHDSFIGKGLAKSDAEKDKIKGSPDNERLLEIFFQVDNTASAGRLHKELFRDLKGYKIDEDGVLVKDDNSILKFDEQRLNIRESMDLSLGQLLWRTKGRGLGNTNEALEKIDKLATEGVISETAAKNATKYLRMLDKESKEHVALEFKAAETRIDSLINNISKEMDIAVEQSILGRLAKSDNTSDDLFEFIAPRNRADTAALAPEMAEESIGRSLQELRKITTDVRKRMADEYGEDIVNIPEDKLLKQLDDLSVTPAAELVTSRTDAVVRDIAGIKDQAAFENLVLRQKKGEVLSNAEKAEIKRGKEALFSLRDMLIGSALRKSRSLIDERAPALRESLKIPRLQGWTETPIKKFNEGYFALNADIDIAAFGNMIDDLQPFLAKVNQLTGQSQFTNDLENLFEGMVAIKARVPLMEETLASIPRELTTSAALSRLYSGFRGVVSWRYLASEQLIREHQRRKGLMLHAILTDPDFVKQLGSLIEGNRFTAKESKIFVQKVASIMGSRMAIYNPDKEEMNYEPSDSDVMRGIRAILVPAGAKYQAGYEESEIGGGMLDRARRKRKRLDRETEAEKMDWPMDAGQIQTPFGGFDADDDIVVQKKKQPKDIFSQGFLLED